MEYVWFVVIGLVVGLVSGRFLQGNNFGVRGDIVFGVIGALLFGVGLSATFASPEIVTGGKAVMAGMGAVLALVLRRVLKSV
ncbi:MAG TPA: hypothetical protein VFV84_08050 [Burkholderiales bacterium]|nr:hypothetical protein [Burkholderiales bacterium]